MGLTLNRLTLGKLQSLSFLVSIKAGQARPGQGKAGQLPGKPRQLPVLPIPLSSCFFLETNCDDNLEQ